MSLPRSASPADRLRHALRRGQALLTTTPDLLDPVRSQLDGIRSAVAPEEEAAPATHSRERLALSAALGVAVLLGATGCTSEDPAQRSMREACEGGRTQDGWVVVDDRKCEQVVRSHGGAFPHYYYYHYFGGSNYGYGGYGSSAVGTPGTSRVSGGGSGGTPERLLTMRQPAFTGADYDMARRQVAVAPEAITRGRGGIDGTGIGAKIGRVAGRGFSMGRGGQTVGRSAFRMSAGRSFGG